MPEELKSTLNTVKNLIGESINYASTTFKESKFTLVFESEYKDIAIRAFEQLAVLGGVGMSITKDVFIIVGEINEKN